MEVGLSYPVAADACLVPSPSPAPAPDAAALPRPATRAAAAGWVLRGGAAGRGRTAMGSEVADIEFPELVPTLCCPGPCWRRSPPGPAIMGGAVDVVSADTGEPGKAPSAVAPAEPALPAWAAAAALGLEPGAMPGSREGLGARGLGRGRPGGAWPDSTPEASSASAAAPGTMLILLPDSSLTIPLPTA